LKTGKKLFIGFLTAVILLAVLSLTLLNRHSSNMRMTALMREGRLAMAVRNYDEAIDIYRLAISINERSVTAYIRLAAACIYNGDVEDAIYFLELGIQKTDSQRLREEYNKLLRALNRLPEEMEE
jgi:tetratricopeptide (TPR) repeat protein